MTLTDSSATRNLILSAVLTLSIISIAWFLGSMKSSPLIPATTLIAADYQMESAIIMQMQDQERELRRELKMHRMQQSRLAPVEKDW